MPRPFRASASQKQVDPRVAAAAAQLFHADPVSILLRWERQGLWAQGRRGYCQTTPKSANFELSSPAHCRAGAGSTGSAHTLQSQQPGLDLALAFDFDRAARLEHELASEPFVDRAR